ncbi:MFS transporter [Novosphingobium sp.]|uniref:MFS transporter n=1 Tax=Novosphingobium sp. TaxID=1874826 RepID=UPI0025EA5DFC|nr:MFS transporter [Novosphingobium sp.]
MGLMAKWGVAEQWGGLDRKQRMTVWAAYLGWTLDAFDFFLMVFMLKAIAADFHTDVKSVSEALFFTLAARPFGALVFGLLAERIGRRPVLVMVILGFSVLSALSGAAQTLGQLLLIRGLFGFAMGGEWGVGASLAMETIPPKSRGLVSGMIQSGYSSGFLIASLAFFALFDTLGWRWMFVLGLAPSAVVLFVRMHVEESPAFIAKADKPRENPFKAIASHWKLALYLIVLMTAFNMFSHGTQDLYPTYLQKQRGDDTQLTGAIAIVMNCGAITGAMLFGPLSERIGRRRAIRTSALLALPVIPLWVWAPDTTVLGPGLIAVGAFVMQMAVQGAWAIVPAHLNELSPAALRATFPGFVYQFGNLIASRNAPLQAGFAESHGDNYALALALVAGVTALVLAGWVSIGPERSGKALAEN